MQSNGAEMLRLACCSATEREVQVVAPVHDALLIEADASNIRDAVAATRAAMAEASRVVLAGVEVDTDVEVIAWLSRYADARGEVMWARPHQGHTSRIYTRACQSRPRRVGELATHPARRPEHTTPGRKPSPRRESPHGSTSKSGCRNANVLHVRGTGTDRLLFHG
jgi:hypothetical protein